MAACLAYVDLNPIRARVAETPETSQFTSVYERIQALGEDAATTDTCRAAWLSPFELAEASPTRHALASPDGSGIGLEETVVRTDQVPRTRASNKACLPMSFGEYLNLLDWTGRQLRADKRGAIPSDLSPILERLHIGDEGWMEMIGKFRRMFRRAAGRPQSMQREREQRGCQALQGIRHSRQVFV